MVKLRVQLWWWKNAVHERAWHLHQWVADLNLFIAIVSVSSYFPCKHLFKWWEATHLQNAFFCLRWLISPFKEWKKFAASESSCNFWNNAQSRTSWLINSDQPYCVIVLTKLLLVRSLELYILGTVNVSSSTKHMCRFSLKLIPHMLSSMCSCLFKVSSCF